MAIADHEQHVILQPLIYTDEDFVFWLKTQRSVLVRWASPDLELVFSSASTTDDTELKSVAPEETKLEDERSRMDWIGQAANQFHRLMSERHAFMAGELRTIAGWVGNRDP